MWTRSTATALVGLAVGLIVSLAAWVFFETLLVFLFLPFVPFLFARRNRSSPTVRRCPRCGFRTTDPEYAYCPRDGARLRASGDASGSAGAGRPGGAGPRKRDSSRRDGRWDE